MIKLLRCFGVLVLLLVALALGALFFAGSALSKAIETSGEYALGVPVACERASPSLFAGSLELGGLQVANPEGFATPYFLRLDKARAAVSLASLRSERVEVPEIALEGIALNLERGAGGTNYGAILDSLKRFEGSGSGQPQPSGPEGKEPRPSGVKFVVRELVVRDVRVRARLAPGLGAASDVELRLPELRLRDVGGTDGASLAEIAARTVEALLAATLDAGGGVLPKDLLKDLGGSLDELGRGVLDDLRGQLDAALKGTDPGARKAVEDLGRKLQDVFK